MKNFKTSMCWKNYHFNSLYRRNKCFRIKCVASPLFLIEIYGRFISINISKEEDVDNDAIVEFIKTLSNKVEYEILSEEIIFRIPIKDDQNEEKKLT